MHRALHLIQQLGCGTVTDLHIDVTTAYSRTNEKNLSVSVSKINALLGIEVPAKDIVKILERLNFKPALDGDNLTLTVPGYREDIDGYPDVAEEIIRFYGYENINGTFLPSASITNGGFTEEQKAENKLKEDRKSVV